MAKKEQKKLHKQAQRRKDIARRKHEEKTGAAVKFAVLRNQYATPALLGLGGPLVACRWSLPRVLEMHLQSAGRTIPPAVSGHLLFDTGASRTCISRRAAAELGLTPLRLQESYGAGGKHESAVFRARLVLALQAGNEVFDLNYETEAQEIPDLEESIEPFGLVHRGSDVRLVGLLGRDLMQHMRVVYDGTTGLFEMRFDLASIKRASQGAPKPPSTAILLTYATAGGRIGTEPA